MRVATVGDIHCKEASQGVFQALFGAMAAAADVLALCGDLTDYGLAEEARGDLMGENGHELLVIRLAKQAGGDIELASASARPWILPSAPN
jgi:Icc-related predicted phosphoesterase